MYVIAIVNLVIENISKALTILTTLWYVYSLHLGCSVKGCVCVCVCITKKFLLFLLIFFQELQLDILGINYFWFSSELEVESHIQVIIPQRGTAYC